MNQTWIRFELEALQMILAYVAETRLRAALEAKIHNMDVKATNMEIHDVGPSDKFEPKPPDKFQHMDLEIQRFDCIYDDEPLGFEKDPMSSSRKMLAQDPLEEVNLGNGEIKRLTYISAKIYPDLKVKVIQLLKDYKDLFAWDYHEILGLSKDLVELKLPIRSGNRPIKQTHRRFVPEIMSKIKAEIKRLLRSKFI